MRKKRIIICGAHFTPALAIIERLKEKGNIDVFYLGRKYPLEGDSALSLEYITLKNLKIPFFSLYGGRLQRSLSWHLVPSLFKFPTSIIQSIFLIMKIKPGLILSFGGYIALPVCLVGWLFGIPVITHEQTRKLGLANRIIARGAKILCLSWPETSNVPKNAEIVLTGNPIRKTIFQPQMPKHLGNNQNLPLIYITGGSLGSRSINMVVSHALSGLTSKYRIIHQCGSSNDHQDYDKLLKIKNSLRDSIKNNYQIREFISPEEVGYIYKQATLMIGRSGINTVTEIVAIGLPALLIPLPWAGENEQEDNAFMVKQLGLAEVILQRKLTVRILLDTISNMMRKITIYRKNAQNAKRKIILNASDRIIDLIESIS